MSSSILARSNAATGELWYASPAPQALVLARSESEVRYFDLTNGTLSVG